MSIGKRSFDLFWAGLGLFCLWPIFFFIAALIKVEDSGPVFYRQKRVGFKARPFYMWKFRTMVVEADTRGLLITTREDPRITKIGKWLRRYKIDEFPQLINVFKGEMSLVGPRPEVEEYVQYYNAKQRQVLLLMPGITDPATIEYRNEDLLLQKRSDPEKSYLEEIMPEKIQLNLSYAKKANFWLDIQVIFRSLAAVLKT